MRMGLIDVDGTKFPNLVLMKLSAYYKAQGHETELLTPDNVFRGNDLFAPFDKLIGACVFTGNMPLVNALRMCGAEIAGCGTDDKRELPYEIEHIMPDYSLYGITDTAYGFLTRGCPRGCPFCIVAAKEGKSSRKVADLSEWWNGQKEIKLCDPNLLACPERFDLLRQLAESRAGVDVNQGFDARLLTKETIDAMNHIKFSMLHFAWDSPNDKTTPAKLTLYNKLGEVEDYRKKRVYVLTNYWSTFEEDLRRVYWLRDNGYDPYIMIFDKYNASKKLRRLQRWVNNKWLFRACDKFDDYQSA